MNSVFIAWFCYSTKITLANQEYTKNYHSTSFQSSCAVEELCETFTSFSYPQLKHSEINYFVEFPPIYQICFQIYPTYNKVPLNLAEEHSMHPIINDTSVFCYDAEEHKELLFNHYHFFRLPFYLEEGTYEVLVHGIVSPNNEENGEKAVFIQRQIHFFQTVPILTVEDVNMFESSVKIISPDQYGLLQRNELFLQIAPHYNYEYKPEAPTSTLLRDRLYPVSYDLLYFHVEGVLNNLLPFPIETLHAGGVEPASWFFSVTPMKSTPLFQEILVNLEEFEDVLALNSTLFPQVKELHYGKTSHHYIEFVLSKEEILEQRHFSNPFHRYTNAIGSSSGGSKSVEQMLQDFLMEEKDQLLQQLETLFTNKLRYYSKTHSLFHTQSHRLENQILITNVQPLVELPAFITSLLRANSNARLPSSFPQQQSLPAFHHSSTDATKRNAASYRNDRKRICIFSSNHMDGQKQIWLTQTRALNRAKYDFHWIVTLLNGLLLSDLSSPNHEVNTAVYQLLELQRMQSRDNIFLHDSPYNNHTISETNLFERVTPNEPAIGEYWGYNKTRLYEFVHQRYEAAKGDIPSITPLWCREFYMILVNIVAAPAPMHNGATGIGCDLMVYGNSRGAYTTDVFLVDVARYLSIPILSELLNLFIDGNALPDVIIAPSTHSKFHESIASPVETLLARTSNEVSVLTTVISPAVDEGLMQFLSTWSVTLGLEKFHPMVPAKFCRVSYLPRRQNEMKQPVVKDLMLWKHSPCVLIGFVARLAPEKNPGLFLQAASYIVRQYPFARFRFIGSGSLTNSLKRLTRRLKLDDVVDFTGWIPSKDLPRYLLDLDIVVNPSLRGWSETFCITNIQSMYLGIPLVTFAVGGIGEYVHAPPSYATPDQYYNKRMINDSSYNSAVFPDVEIAHNAVILHSAHPKVIAEGVMRLLLDPMLAQQLRERAQQSLFPYFTAARQIQQYDNLYTALLEAHAIAKRKVFG